MKRLEITVSTRGQITIPKSIRQHFMIRPGDKVIVTTKPGKAILRPIRWHINGLHIIREDIKKQHTV